MPIIKCYNTKCHYWDENDNPDNCSHPMIEMQKCNDAIIRKDSPLKSKNFYYQELMRDQCFCGATKKKRYSFCYPCYHKLPGEMKSGLWLEIGEGYEEAYEEAVKFLES